MSRRTGDDTNALTADSWHGVRDPRKRKQIQDRLAQRARRRRLRDTRSTERATESSLPTDGLSSAAAGASTFNPDVHESRVSSLDLPSASTSESPEISRDHSILPQVSISVCEALFKNGAMMGLPCSVNIPSKSSPATSSTPLPLHPTPLQLLTIHLRWIDRFPSARMRDNMVSLSGVFDDEEFLHDLITMPSFTLKSGGASWDPASWVADKVWAEKWGFLLN